MARRSLRVIRAKPLVWSFVYNFAALPLAMIGLSYPMDGRDRHVGQFAAGRAQFAAVADVVGVDYVWKVFTLLIPVSVVLVFVIGLVFWWSLRNGQFDDMEGPAYRVLMDNDKVGMMARRPERQNQRRLATEVLRGCRRRRAFVGW